jgi:hypothetical protein
MNFDPATLLASFVFSAIGVYYFRQGKKDAEIRVVFVGLALIFYGYFVEGLILNLAVGASLWALAHAFRNQLL